MSEVIIVRTEAGLQGLGEKHGRAYERWRKQVASMEVGETLQFSWKAPRSPKFHRLFFAMLGNLFDAQEQFAEPDQLRSWLTVGAGFCDFVPGPKGRMVALPKSIAWANMDDEEFRPLVDAVWGFLVTPHATGFLWPMLTEQGREEAVARLLAGYEAEPR
jgi:hypothetical protein